MRRRSRILEVMLFVIKSKPKYFLINTLPTTNHWSEKNLMFNRKCSNASSNEGTYQYPKNKLLQIHRTCYRKSSWKMSPAWIGDAIIGIPRDAQVRHLRPQPAKISPHKSPRQNCGKPKDQTSPLWSTSNQWIFPGKFFWRIFRWNISVLPKKPGFTPCLDRLCSRWTRSQSVDQRFWGVGRCFSANVTKIKIFIHQTHDS